MITSDRLVVSNVSCYTCGRWVSFSNEGVRFQQGFIHLRGKAGEGGGGGGGGGGA